MWGNPTNPKARFIINIALYSVTDTNVLCLYHAVNMPHLEAKEYS
jgi:hypothetical protein